MLLKTVYSMHSIDTVTDRLIITLACITWVRLRTWILHGAVYWRLYVYSMYVYWSATNNPCITWVRLRTSWHTMVYWRLSVSSMYIYSNITGGTSTYLSIAQGLPTRHRICRACIKYIVLCIPYDDVMLCTETPFDRQGLWNK